MRRIIQPGKSKDGYWQAPHVIAQVHEAIDSFEKKYPDAIGVWAFDQSSNHCAFAKDALVVSVLLVGDETNAKNPPAPSRKPAPP